MPSRLRISYLTLNDFTIAESRSVPDLFPSSCRVRLCDSLLLTVRLQMFLLLLITRDAKHRAY